MMRKSCAVTPLLLAAMAVACNDDGPTTPTGATIVIYQDTNFRGDSRAVASNAPDLDDLPGCGGAGADWDDCISSIRVPTGWEITVFEHDDYTGASMTFTADVADLEQQRGPCGDDWDDCISSIQVRQR
jgi:Peptidase inhibitor family I36